MQQEGDPIWAYGEGRTNLRSMTSEKRLFLLLRTPLGRKLLLGSFLRLRRTLLGRKRFLRVFLQDLCRELCAGSS